MSTKTNTTKEILPTFKNNEHLLKLEELCAYLNTDCFDGLTNKHAKQLLKTNGLNVYSKPKQMGGRHSSIRARIFQGKKSRENWSKSDWNRVFNSRSTDSYTVVRDGARVIVKRFELVPGDLIILQGREIVPADMRIISYNGELVVDNRIITGNTAELKSNSPTSSDFLLTQNMMYACTELLSGSCEAIVLRTADETIFGELTQFAQKVKLVKRQTRLSLSSTSSGSNSSLGTLSRHSSLDAYDGSIQENVMSPPSPVIDNPFAINQ